MATSNVHNLESASAQSIPRLLEALAARNPDAIAVAAPGHVPLSFNGLFAHVQKVVNSLGNMGVGKGDRVAVVLPNGPEMAVAFLGVASASVCTPLNPAYTANEFEFYFSDLQPKALIVQSDANSPAVLVARKRTIPMIELSPTREDGAGAFSLSGIRQECVGRSGRSSERDRAMVLYTSGTTSRPKMVPLTHSNLLASAGNIVASLQLDENDRSLNMMPLFHIHGLVGGVLAPLMAGGSVVCTSGFGAIEFYSWLEEFHPTWYTAVPTIHRAVLDGYRGKTRRFSLRLIRSSSAALPLRVKERLEEVFSVPVIEAYGMTEAAHQISSNPLPPRERKPGSVGVPVGVEVAIMGVGDDLLSHGAVGEIVIRGRNVTVGYGNDPQANEKSFRDGWFKTGDQGFLDEDGYLFLTGRLKEMINRGGEKISPQELDKALLQHPAVREAASFGLPHPTLGEDVAAAVVMHQHAFVTVRELREFMLARLAPHKVPDRIVFTDVLPKGSSWKIQRTGLAEHFGVQLRQETRLVRSGIETIVANIYADVPELDRVGAEENVFALGGDSLRATQVISRVRAIFQVGLPIATVFKNATVAELAEQIASDANTKERTLSARILEEVEKASQKVGADK